MIAATVLITGLLTLPSPTSAASGVTVRYCQRPQGPGAYVAATPNVACGIALAVARQITKQRCWQTEQCDIDGFVCISYWSGSFRRPFSYSHHGICPAPRGRRIEFDLG
jgi:hypothetical protein